MASEKQYIELYEAHAADISAHSCDVMNGLRPLAFEHFQKSGFPSQKVERYKYTDVEKAFTPDYGVNIKRVEFPVNPYDAFKCSVPNMGTSLFFVVNDIFYRKGQPMNDLPEGVRIGSLCDEAQANPQLVSAYYGKLADTSVDGITALNTMLAQDGLFIYIPRNTKVEHPVQIVNVSRADVDMMANRRVLIIIEEGAEASFLFCDHALDDRHFLTTQVVEVFAGENSRLELYGLEETHAKNTRFNNMYVRQDKDSSVELNSITLHNGFTRNRLDVLLEGEGADISAYGCVVADREEHVDNNALIDHRVGKCRSDVLYKYVLDGQSVGAFVGHVLVRQDAQHTESHERNANICVTDTARMYTQPMLEIYADDVKCNHGSTVGQLDEKALFYMCQRGISQEEARMLLQHAFAEEVIRRIRLDALRERLSHLVEMRFRGELDSCKGCKMCR